MVKALRCVLIVLMSLPLLACPTMRPTYLAQPEVIKAEGLYIHTASGMAFPSKVGNFQRGAVRRYDAEGLDVSAGYDLITPSGAVAATVYVYPAPSLVSIGSPPEVVASARARLSQNEFETRKQEILHVHPGARLIQEREVSMPWGSMTYSGRMATFEFEDFFAGQRQVLRSHVYLFSYVGEKWTIKYRFTHPKSFDATKEIEGFMQSLSWTLISS